MPVTSLGATRTRATSAALPSTAHPVPPSPVKLVRATRLLRSFRNELERRCETLLTQTPCVPVIGPLRASGHVSHGLPPGSVPLTQSLII